MNGIFLVPVNPRDVKHLTILYDLLDERTPNQSISHKGLPSYEDHIKFVESNPYYAWYIVYNHNDVPVGSTYLTRKNEIGIFIYDLFKGHGYGKDAVRALMTSYDGPFYANINPSNAASIAFFDSLGFKFIQVTYEKQAADGR